VELATAGLHRLIGELRELSLRLGLQWSDIAPSSTLPWSDVESVLAREDQNEDEDDDVDRSDGSRSGQHHHPMLSHAGEDLVALLGICHQDRALAQWALFSPPDRMQGTFLEAALRISRRTGGYSVSLSRGLRAHPALCAQILPQSESSAYAHGSGYQASLLHSVARGAGVGSSSEQQVHDLMAPGSGGSHQRSDRAGEHGSIFSSVGSRRRRRTRGTVFSESVSASGIAKFGRLGMQAPVYRSVDRDDV